MLSPKFTTVTKFSKIVALTLFVALPFIGFYYGIIYERNLLQANLIQLKIENDTLKAKDKASSVCKPTINVVLEQSLKSYSNKAFGFSFNYSDKFTDIPLKNYGGSPTFMNDGYVPLCEYPYPAVVATCMILKKDVYPNSNFEGASVNVSIVPEKKTKWDCEDAVNEYANSVPRDVTITKIGGIEFIKGSYGDSGAGHQLKGNAYFTYYRNICYSIFTGIKTTNAQNYEKGTINPLTISQLQDIENSINQILDSFVFSN